MNSKKKPQKRIITVYTNWIFRVIQGALIGISAILPGISGGVLCVVFGIYEPMMALLAHPFKTFKRYSALLLPVLIGWVLGFWGLAGLVAWLFSSSYNPAVWLFIGLIGGMLPSLFKEAGKEGRTTGAWVSLIISFIVVLALLIFLKLTGSLNIKPNIWWFLVCGILWGVSLIVPGLSSSSLLIFLGLYEPMSQGINDFSLDVIIPMIIGVFFTVFALARVVNLMFRKKYSIIFHAILGFVLASTISIIPIEYSGGLNEILICAACFAGGFAAALGMDKIGIKIQAKKNARQD